MSGEIGIFGVIDGGLTLGLSIAALALIYVAVARIVSKAGYPWVWLIVPLAPIATGVVCLVELYRELHTLDFGGPYIFLGVSDIGIWWKIFLIALGLNGVMFFAFAFSRWPTVAPREKKAKNSLVPVSRGFAPDEMAGNTSRRFGSKGPGFATNKVAESAPPQAPAAAASAPPAPAATGPVVKRCVWCGEALPGSRALFHDCGPTDRPPAFCAKCGSALSESSGSCAACSVTSANA
jgi:hypothetical protein